MKEIKVWNRLEDECCVMCGSQLISPKDAELGMCTMCLKAAQKGAKKQIKESKSRTGNVKRFCIRVNPALIKQK